MSAKGREKTIKDLQQRKAELALTQTDNPQGGGTINGESQTLAGNTKNLLTKRLKKPAYMQSLNEAEKAENFKIIDNMSKKITFLKNPRYAVNKVPILMTQVIIS